MMQQVVRRGDLKKPPGLLREATSTSQYYKKSGLQRSAAKLI